MQFRAAVRPTLGPMARDFHAPFGLGLDDKVITSLDGAGLALAAIQGLNEKPEERDARIAQLESELAPLKSLVQKIAGVDAAQ